LAALEKERDRAEKERDEAKAMVAEAKAERDAAKEYCEVSQDFPCGQGHLWSYFDRRYDGFWKDANGERDCKERNRINGAKILAKSRV
jgi:hypothetical protein